MPRNGGAEAPPFQIQGEKCGLAHVNRVMTMAEILPRGLDSEERAPAPVGSRSCAVSIRGLRPGARPYNDTVPKNREIPKTVYGFRDY
jgi:hypothetical protein